MKPCPSERLRPSSMPCANPASITSASLRNPSPSVRARDRNDQCRRQCERFQSQKLPVLLGRVSCSANGGSPWRFLSRASRRHVGRSRGKTWRNESQPGYFRRHSHAQGIHGHREQGGRSDQGASQRRASQTSRAENRCRKNPKIRERKAASSFTQVQNSRE